MAYSPTETRANVGAGWADNGRTDPSQVQQHPNPLSGGAGLGRPQTNPEAGQTLYGPSLGTARAAHQTNVIGNPSPGNGADIDAWPLDATRETDVRAVDSWEQPLVAERARGVDGAGGHPHAGHRIYQYSRPWEFDNPEWGSLLRGLHILEVPGASEPSGVGPGYVALPQPLTTRVPPPRWDEVYRYGPGGETQADISADTTGL